MTRQLRALACRASLSLDLHAEADQGSFPQFPHPSSGSVLLEGTQGRPGVHWRGSHSSEKGRITSLQGDSLFPGKRTQWRHSKDNSELPAAWRNSLSWEGAGMGDGAKEPGSGAQWPEESLLPPFSPRTLPSSSWLRFSLFSSKG